MDGIEVVNVYVGKSKIENRWIDIHNEVGFDAELPIFTKLDDLKSIINKKSVLICPVRIDSECFMAI